MSNEILTRAFHEVYDEEFGSIPSKEEIAKTHEYSDKFKAKIQKLIKKSKMKYIYIFNMQIRRMAAVTMIIIGILAASLTVEAIRKPIINFFVTAYEKFSAVFFISDNDSGLYVPEAIEILYSPADIPDGYNLEDKIINSILRELFYTNADGDEIMFKQYIISSEITINTEGIITEDIFIRENKGVFYSNMGLNTILWNDNQYGYLVTGSIDKDVLQAIAESIKAEK
jgi:hypothetical protein